jgi:cation-transporting ATPase E
MGALEDSNATAAALTEAFGKTKNKKKITGIPFSSERKWSGAAFQNKGSYVIGSPNIIFSGNGGDFLKRADSLASEGLRVLCLASSEEELKGDNLPPDLICAALLIFSDRIRDNAAETIKYFTDENVAIKMISGDNPKTAGFVAAKAGLADADKVFDMDTSAHAGDIDYTAIARDYAVFGHVTPEQKKELIRGLKNDGRTVCMMGDGVNDILAMRESDCGVAMVGGSAAARAAGDFVLMTADFNVMTDVLREGRKVINNIEKVAAIFLLKTVYSVILTLIYIFLPYPYPIYPLRMTPVNDLTVGIPSFFIALQANYSLPKSQMLDNVLGRTLPAAITVVFNAMYIQTAGLLFGLPGLTW